MAPSPAARPAPAGRLRRAARAAAATLARTVGNAPPLVGVAGTAAALAVVVLPLFPIAVARAEALEHARETAANLSSIVALDLERNGRFYGLLLETMVEGAQDVRTWRLPEDMRSRLIFGGGPAADYLDAEYVIGADGRLKASPDGAMDPTIQLSHRDYFLFHQRNPSAGVFVSHPFASALHGGSPSIALTQRINGPGRAFAGVAFLEVRLAYFQQLFARLATGPDGAVFIVLEDGTVLARKPFDERDVGTSIASLPGFAQTASRDSGSFVAAGDRGDAGVKRLYTFARVPGLPLIAVVAPSVDDALADWRRQSLLAECVALAFGVVLALGSWLLVYTLRGRQQAQAELARLATTDPLTGLANRRTLDQRLEQEWGRARRTGGFMSILFIDIDRFKLFNDAYGHAAGDEVLVSVAKCIASSARRAVDVTARYGGEEFAVVLPDTPAAGALEIAGTIRRRVEQLALANEGSEHGNVTVSVGCATCCPAKGGIATKLLAIADEQLYAAKSAGRNQVKSVVVTAMAAEPTQQPLPAGGR
ncbi:diguanylate cyclase [Burkholderia sp. WAC0059]|uniref:sensor domain-containing diguanylate cyclase n=1 Tax=Burkholderia sp. WAC0059 TaxID=2066022 RepID=UPI000C7EC7C9|nr:diguanylate cyclase [Burkholderia sp. WAC0059]PLZ03244.1 diguanylate cyclase [Burkholderia sp. WAC0059]